MNIDKKELIEFLNYLLEHIEGCYYNECKTMVERFLKRNGIKNNNN